LPVREEQGRLIHMDARELIEGLGGERASFVRLTRRRVANDADAEDVVHHALLRAADRATQIADPSRARAWFYRLLRRAIVDHHRARAARAKEGNALDDGSAEEDDRPRAPSCRCALRLLGEIRPAYTEVVRRVDYAGEDPSALAEALGISPANLHVRLHRARRALRERVEAHCGVTSIGPCLECLCDADHRCGSS
jgi:RNA polymerase sigma-70 factor (ECF subfamily)